MAGNSPKADANTKPGLTKSNRGGFKIATNNSKPITTYTIGAAIIGLTILSGAANADEHFECRAEGTEFVGLRAVAGTFGGRYDSGMVRPTKSGSITVNGLTFETLYVADAVSRTWLYDFGTADTIEEINAKHRYRFMLFPTGMGVIQIAGPHPLGLAEDKIGSTDWRHTIFNCLQVEPKDDDGDSES